MISRVPGLNCRVSRSWCSYGFSRMQWIVNGSPLNQRGKMAAETIAAPEHSLIQSQSLSLWRQSLCREIHISRHLLEITGADWWETD